MTEKVKELLIKEVKEASIRLKVKPFVSSEGLFMYEILSVDIKAPHILSVKTNFLLLKEVYKDYIEEGFSFYVKGKSFYVEGYSQMKKGRFKKFIEELEEKIKQEKIQAIQGIQKEENLKFFLEEEEVIIIK